MILDTSHSELVRRYDEAIEKIVELRDTLKKISDWCEAYPLGFAGGIFDEPDMEEVQRRLGSELLTQLSAHNFRHVLRGIQKIVEESK